MRRAIPFILLLLLLAGVMVAILLRSSHTPGAVRLTASFPRQGTMLLSGVQAAREVVVRDATGRVVARERPRGHSALELFFHWRPDKGYEVDAGPAGKMLVRSPSAFPQLAIRVHAPLGQKPREYTFSPRSRPMPVQRIPVPTAPLGAVDIMVEVEKLSDSGPVILKLLSDASNLAAQGVKIEPSLEEKSFHLDFEFDKFVQTFRVCLGQELPNKTWGLTIKNDEFAFSMALDFVARRLDAGKLVIVEWLLPTDSEGRARPQQVSDRILMPNPVWDYLAAWCGIRPHAINYYEPFTWQTLRLRNDTSQGVALFLTSEVLDPLSRRPMPYFASPEYESTGGTGRIRGFVQIGPRAMALCTLPVYVAADTPPGTYIRRIEITPMGAERPIKTLEKPLGVARSRPLFTTWVIGASLVALAWAAITALFYRRLVSSLGVRIMVLLSLLGSLQFCLSFLGGLVSNVLYAFLGPFNCLVGGLFTEVMTYLLVTSILFLVPRVGAMTIAGIVTYLMGGVLFGSFGISDILFVGSSIAFRELFLVILGVTSLGGANQGEKNDPGDSTVQPWSRDQPRLVPMMLALGLADATSTFTSLALYAVLYRLFFANWYILLQVIVTGFLYTALGVYLGRPLGRSLRRVHL